MSRFGEGDGEEFPGQYELWQANARRAIDGRRGQAALRDLEQALLDLPAPRLISGHLATRRGEVCAVGALALYRRCNAGEDRDAVLSDLQMHSEPSFCTCSHVELDHADLEGACSGCVATAERARKRWTDAGREIDEDYLAKHYACQSFVLDEEYSEDDPWVTTQVAQKVGLSSVLAWELAYSNDERFGHLTPEERYARTLEWVRSKIKPEPVAAA